eukprot:scaffold244900_cov19-Tisochrysis_lutea.AAC.1
MACPGAAGCPPHVFCRCPLAPGGAANWLRSLGVLFGACLSWTQDSGFRHRHPLRLALCGHKQMWTSRRQSAAKQGGPVTESEKKRSEALQSRCRHFCPGTMPSPPTDACLHYHPKNRPSMPESPEHIVQGIACMDQQHYSLSAFGQLRHGKKHHAALVSPKAETSTPLSKTCQTIVPIDFGLCCRKPMASRHAITQAPSCRAKSVFSCDASKL